MGIHQPVGTFFIDARIPWLHNAPLHLQDNLMQNAHIVVYNSAHLPSSSPLHLAQKIKLFDGDISPHLVQGYILGSEQNSDSATRDPIRQ